MADIYQFEINTSGCNYELWLNGMRADIQMGNFPIVYDLPVNQWVKSGDNRIEVKVLPLQGRAEVEPKAYFRLTVSRGNVKNKQFSKLSEVKKIETPSFAELKEKNKEADLSVYVLRDSFLTEFAFTNKVFSDLTPLTVTKPGLINVYKTVAGYFQSKDVNSLLRLMEYKMRELSKSYQENYNEEVQRQRQFMEDLFTKQLEEVDYNNYQLKYFLNNTMVCLEDEEGDQPIFFSDDIDEGLVFYPFYFGIPKGQTAFEVVL